MNCKDFQEIIDSFLSDELLTETNHDMILHIESCQDCHSVIEVRRQFRKRLQSAVASSARFALPDGFDHRLITRIRHESEPAKKSDTSWFGFRVFAAAAVVLVFAVSVFTFFSMFDGPESTGYMIAGFDDHNLINIASGDHQHCAIRHDLAEFPIALANARPEYRGLDKLVEQNLRASLADHRLVEAHACKFENVRFAHFVMKDDNEVVSVLIAPDRGEGGAVEQRIRGFSSAAYDVKTFGAAGERVFVISNRGSDSSRIAADSLARPLEAHFSSQKLLRTAALGIPFSINRVVRIKPAGLGQAQAAVVSHY